MVFSDSPRTVGNILILLQIRLLFFHTQTHRTPLMLDNNDLNIPYFSIWFCQYVL
jgi:hypothetical protein